MSVHLVKLCVGVDAVEELAAWQQHRLEVLRAEGKPELFNHVTRMMPKRRDELTDGGSLYWVIKGHIQVRQPLVDIDPFKDADGIKRCRLIYSPDLILTAPQPRRPFQGWRYLKVEDAPRDIGVFKTGSDIVPAEMKAELMELGLL